MAPLMRFLRREPLVHFLTLGALLFAFDALWSSDKKDTITVSRPTIDFLIKQREDLELRPLTPAQREELVNRHIDDEILYREAYARGFDKNPRMRRDLVRMMRSLEISKIGEPPNSILRAYFDSHRERYRRSPKLSLMHVFFRKPSAPPNNLLDRLRSGSDPHAAGDKMPGAGTSLEYVDQLKLVYLLGSDAARAVTAIEDDDWHGPLKSRHGVHFVRVVARHAGEPLVYEEVAHTLKIDWRREMAHRAAEAQTRKLREKYNIVIERTEPGR